MEQRYRHPVRRCNDQSGDNANPEWLAIHLFVHWKHHRLAHQFHFNFELDTRHPRIVYVRLDRTTSPHGLFGIK